MDQAAFRSLLSTPGPSRPSSTNTTRFGAAPPKRGTTSKDEYKKPEFKPRVPDKKKFKKKDKDEGEGAYRDRAAERRGGKDGDFSAAERLLEDFKARSEAAEDKAAVEEQMKYLGGDAEHTILVKGLDMALLERQRAQQSEASDRTIEDVEEELDAVLIAQPKKRTRDEMLAELKKSRGVEPAPDDEAARLEKAKQAGRFKPINAPAVKANGKGKEVEAGSEKKRRKKKRPDGGAMAPPPVPTKAAPAPSPIPAAPTPAFTPHIDDVDDDGDIFGGAGDYKGLDSDSDDDTSAPRPTPASLPAPTIGEKRKYFDDDPADDLLSTTAPSSVSNLAAAQAEATEADEEVVERPMRLQPLSGSSVPSVRDLLDMDKAAEKEELRLAKKLKNKVEAGDRAEGEKRQKVRTAEDKSNHDFQVMSKFLENKEKRAKGIAVDEDE